MLYKDASKETIQKNIERSKEWNKTNLKSVTIQFNKVSDKDIIDKLNEVSNRTDYIRQLIRKDIEQSN